MLILCVWQTCGTCDPYAYIRIAMLKFVIICMRFLHLLCLCIFCWLCYIYFVNKIFFFVLFSDIKKQFSIPPVSVRVEAGGRSEIRCGAPSGVPQATLQWLKNGAPLMSDSSVLVTAEGNVLITHASLQVSLRQSICYTYIVFL